MTTVSICTPTYNRRPFIPYLIEMVRRQSWPKDSLEWIIVDDGTDKINDILEQFASDMKSIIRYFPISHKMTLGAKRNFMHDQSQSDFIVYMDDDDYYPPNRVKHAIESLQANPECLIAGSSVIHIFFKHIDRIVEFGPYGRYHATAGTFAFRKELLLITTYQEHACLAEEKHFLKGYTIPMVQLDPYQTILVFSHRHNTFDKKKLLSQAPNSFIHETTKTVDDFIKLTEEEKLKEFFVKDLNSLLISYPPGEPIMKPDVIRQTKEIDEKRRQSYEESLKPLIYSNPVLGATPTINKAMDIIKHQENVILNLQETIRQERLYRQKQAEYIQNLKSKMEAVNKVPIN